MGADLESFKKLLSTERQLHGVMRLFHDLHLYLESHEDIEEAEEVAAAFTPLLEATDYTAQSIAAYVATLDKSQQEEFFCRLILLFMEDRYAKRWKDSNTYTARMLLPMLAQELDNCQDALLEDGKPVMVN